MDINEIRKNYRFQKLNRSDLKESPIEMFELWMQEAMNAQIVEVNALALATADAQGVPSCRTVLLKHVDERGFAFFTNYKSHKGHDLDENPRASMTFFWRELERQVCIDGDVEKISADESDVYFAMRPRESQISAWASKQGDLADNRKELEAAYAKYEKKFEGKNVPRPPHWGGFRLVPNRIEFWQGREDRLHDRFNYRKEGSEWIVERLAP